MRPFAGISLLKRTILNGAEYTSYRAVGRYHASSTKPLPLWYVGNAIAILMDSYVATVAEYYSIRILTLPIATHAAFIALIIIRMILDLISG